MISKALQRIIDERSARQESVTATALLKSDRPSRADVWCAQREHRLGRVYEIGGKQLLVTQGFTTLRAQFYTDVPADDLSEVAVVDWTYEIPKDVADASTGAIHLRCACSHWWTSVAQIKRQMMNLRPGDRRLMVSISRRHSGSDDTP